MPPQAAERSSIAHTISVHRGMIDKVEPWYLSNDAAAYLQNLDITRPGSRKRRFGTSSIGGNTDEPAGLWAAKDSVFDREVLFGVWGGNIYVVPGSGQVTERASGISLVSALHGGVAGRWGDRIATYISQMQWDDSSASVASGLVAINDNGDYSQSASMAPIATTWFQARLWALGNVLTENDETVWWSELNDGLSYSLTNTAQIEPGLGGRLVGAVGVRGQEPQLVIFKERAICLFLPRWGSNSAYLPGPADALDTVYSSIRIVATNTGCVASRSIQYTPGSPLGDVIFLSPEGFRTLRVSDDNTTISAGLPASDPIHDTIDRINFSMAHKAASCVHDNIYHCAVPLDGAIYNTHVISLDLATGAWYLNTWAARDLTIGRLNQERDILWMQYAESKADSGATGSFTGYHAYQCLTGFLDPGGVPVVFREDTRGYLPTGNIQEKQVWDRVGITIKNEAGATSAITVSYNIDQSGWVTAGSLTFNANTLIVELGETPLPWEPNTTAITTKYLSLRDAPPGYEIQIRYVSEDEFAIPSILDVAVWAAPIGPEFDNEIS